MLLGGSDRPNRKCGRDRLRPIRHAKLAKYALQVALDRELTDMEDQTDLVIALAFPHALQNSKFARRQLAAQIRPGIGPGGRPMRSTRHTNALCSKLKIKGKQLDMGCARSQRPGIVIDEHENAAIAEQVAYPVNQRSAVGRENDRSQQRRDVFQNEGRLPPRTPQFIDLTDEMLLGRTQLSGRQKIVLSKLASFGLPRATGNGLSPYPERSVWYQGIYRPANPRGVLLRRDDIDRHLAHLNGIEQGFGERHRIAGVLC